MLPPAESLEGKDLPGGWKVTTRIPRTKTATGGNFSTGYFVEHKDGRKCFLKAMDYMGAFLSRDTVAELAFLTAAYMFEKNVCEQCRDHQLRRVVHAIDSGEIVADSKNIFSKVHYLIFELATGDIRKYLDIHQAYDLAFVLRTLHHVATGLQQLHGVNIAHQDLKPSNVLVMGKETGAKISDFGRAWSKDFHAEHNTLVIAGDTYYAPPELLYGEVASDVNTRRYGCDAYHLGSLMVFFFTLTHMNGLIGRHLANEHEPFRWGGTYAEVLPYIQEAFGKALQDFKAATPNESAEELTGIVSRLCEPDPVKRGHPLNRCGHQNQFSLERFISQFDLLASRAEIQVRGGQKTYARH